MISPVLHVRRVLCLITSVLVLSVFVCAVGCRPVSEGDGTRRLRMAHVYEVRSPTHHYGTAHLAERLQTAGGGLDVTIFPGGQLGSEEELLEQLVAGEIELAIAGPSFLGMWHPPLGVFDAAYVFRDLDHMLATARGELMAEHWEELRRRYGVRVLDTWAYGSRHLTANRPIRSPDDLKGFRLRLPGARIWQASGAALGASPMPISFGEVYLALQQGIADGQENPVPVIRAMGFHEVQKYLSLTGHIQSSIQILINERVWNSLTSEQQTALTVSIRELGEEVYRGTLTEEQELLEEWRRNGTLEVLSDIDVAAFRQRSREYFSTGFPFSELYLQITDDARITSESTASPPATESASPPRPRLAPADSTEKEEP